MPDSVIPAEWIAKAQRDLLSARVLRSVSPPLLEPAIYHAAQELGWQTGAEIVSRAGSVECSELARLFCLR
jgi:hypothetical protein